MPFSSSSSPSPRKTMAKEFLDDFKCPISLEIMSDQLILSSGHTFDRISIKRWLDSGHHTCLITNLPLPDQPFLIPNHALRSLISNYTNISLRRPQPPSNPQALIYSLMAKASSFESKVESLSQLVRLSKHDSVIPRKINEVGAIPAILQFIDSDDPSLQEKALSLLLNLSAELDDHIKVGLVVEGAINRVVRVLRFGVPDYRAIDAMVITGLAGVEVNKAIIRAYPYAIPALVSLVVEREGRVKKEAATAAISSFSDNRRRAIDCGVEILMELLDSGGRRKRRKKKGAF